MKPLATIIFNIRSATILCAMLLLLSSSAFPQATITHYSRATFSGTYASITGSSGPSGDDVGMNVSLPFTFPYDGHNYNQIWICTNGWAELGSVSSPLSYLTSTNNSDLFTANLPHKTLAPWWDDLATGSGAIQYTTLGSAPNRVFAIEWANVLSFYSGGRTISFQLRLYETSGVIEFWYGSATGVGNGAESASFGIKDSVGGPGHFIDGPTGSSTVGTTNLTTTSNWPSVFYRFSNQPIQVVQPNGGEFYYIGFTDTIKWFAAGPTNVKLEYSTDAGGSWSLIAASTPASTGSYAWAVPNTPTTEAKVRISDASNASVFDVSDTLFTIQEPPSVTVAPDSFAVTVGSGDSTTQTLTIGNTGTGVLSWSITSAPSATLVPMVRSIRSNAVNKLNLKPDETADNPKSKAKTTYRTTHSSSTTPLPFFDSFEDGTYSRWTEDYGTGIREVTSATAADGQYSFHYQNTTTGHFQGIHVDFVPGSQPHSVSFYVRPGSTSLANAYFVLTADSSNADGIFFYATAYGHFYVNADVGGDNTYPYNADQWYYIEFKNIDWANQTFDYYVNRALVEASIQFRNAGTVTEFYGLYLYNFNASEAWWDAIDIGGQANFISFMPSSGTVAPGTSQNVAVKFTTQGLTFGDYRANIVINSNDPIHGTKNVPVHLIVPVPKIALQPDSLSRTISDNDSVALPFTISNTGAAGSKLLYNISAASLSKIVTSISLPAITQTHVSSSSSLQSTSSTGGPKVLLLFADDAYSVSDVKSKISSAGNFSAVDTMNIQYTTPTLLQLASYNAVFVYEGSYYSNSPDALGDVLADYVDAGGGVVTALFASNTYNKIGGRFDSQNYWAIEPGYTTSYNQQTLGTIYVPNHPIMRGVSTFNGGYDSFRFEGTNLASDATLIASWSDGAPLVAVKNNKGKNRVDLGFYPPSSDVNYDYWLSSTDGAKLMANALAYVTGGGAQASVTFVPDLGSIAVGSPQTVQIIIKTTNTRQGNYILNVGIESNDPDSAIAVLPVRLTVKDWTPPRIAIRFFQNEAFPQYLNIVSVAHESLYSPVFKVALGTDTSRLAPALIDSANFVYNVDYKLTHSGTLSAIISADDSLGNDTTVIRQVAVQNASSTVPTTLVSTDMKARIEIPENSVAKETYIIAQIVDDATVPTSERGIGPSYQFGPQSLSFTKPVKLSINIPSLPNGLDLVHVGIYSSNNGTLAYLPTQVDMKSHTLHAEVAKLGEFLLAYNPAIQSEIYQDAPREYELEQNFPNPFNGGTVIQYALPVAGSVELTIYNVLGQQVTTLLKGYQPQGYHEVRWEGMTAQGTIVSSGMYFYQLNAGAKTLIRKMVFMK